MAEEKIVVFNLRKDFLKTRRGMKSNRAISALRQRIQKMFKEHKVVIDKAVNDALWERGMKNPRAKLRLKVKPEEKIVKVELEK
jgi:ribosomal protein L31E